MRPIVRILASVIIVIVSVAVLVLPWYPVVRSQTVTQTFTYTYQVPSQSFQTQTIYTLPSPVSLQGLLQSGIDYSRVFQNLGDVSLESGWIVSVDVTECQSCYTGLEEDFGNKAAVYSVGGSTNGYFIVPQSGNYKIVVSNLGTTEEVVSSISITADIPQDTVETRSGYNTASYQTYSVKDQSPIVAAFPSFNNPLLLYGLAAVVLVCAIIVIVYVVKKGKGAASHEPVANRYCVSCGSPMKGDSEFCDECGTKQT